MTDHDVFLSYSRRDEPRIRSLVAALESEGLGLWWDRRIGAGAEFDRVIEQRLASARCVLVVWSTDSIESEWVRTEAAEGLERGILVPVVLDDVQPPLAFRRRQSLLLDDSEASKGRVVAAIRDVLEGRGDSAPAAAAAGRPDLTRNRRTLAWLGVFGAVLLFLGVLAGVVMLRAAPMSAPLAFLVSLEGLEQRPPSHDDRPFAVSPDGSWLAWVGEDPTLPYESVLFLKPMGQVAPRRIENSRGALTPTFSPDSGSLAFFADGELRRTSVDGGPAVTIARIPQAVINADWCADDTILFVNGHRHPIHRVRISDGVVDTLTELQPGHTSHRNPACVGDGVVVFTAYSEPGTRMLLAFDSNTGRYVELTPGEDNLFLPPDHLVFQRGDGLYTARFDTGALGLKDTPRPLVDGVPGEFSISEDGQLFAERALSPEAPRLVVERGGMRYAFDPSPMRNPRLSPSGELVATERRGPDGWQIWIHDVAEGLPARQLTSSGGQAPVWSPDGRRIAFTRSGVGIFEVPIDGTAAPSLRIPVADVVFARQWTDAGILHAPLRLLTGIDLLLSTDSEEQIEIDGTPATSAFGAISPDGRFLAYSTDTTGRQEVYVRRFPDGQTRWRVTKVGGSAPRWAEGGEQLYYRVGEHVERVPVLASGDQLAFGPPEQVARLHLDGGLVNCLYDVTEDGTTLAYLEYPPSSPPLLLYMTGLRERLGD